MSSVLGMQSNGKVIIFKGLNDEKPDLQPADEIDLSDFKDTYLIYKPLGSPFLNGEVRPGYGNRYSGDYRKRSPEYFWPVQKPESRGPTAFSRYFRRFPIIFLGYPMDMWHFRLVGQVFRSIGVNLNDSTNLAVRLPVSDMENMAWRRLGVNSCPWIPTILPEGFVKIYESGRSA